MCDLSCPSRILPTMLKVSVYILLSYCFVIYSRLFFKGPAADATDTPQPWGLLCNPVMKMIVFFIFPCNRAPVEWNWKGKTEVLGEKPVPMPLCPPQILHELTRFRTLASAVRGRRLTAWATARPESSYLRCYMFLSLALFIAHSLRPTVTTGLPQHCNVAYVFPSGFIYYLCVHSSSTEPESYLPTPDTKGSNYTWSWNSLFLSRPYNLFLYGAY
jgi:hypothetical protein